MAIRYFHTSNARQRIGGEFQFEVYGFFGSCPYGVYAAVDAGEQGRLEKLMSEPRNALTEITEEEYQSHLKKNSHQVSSASVKHNPPPVLNPPAPPADKSAVIEQPPINPEAFAPAQEIKLPEPSESFKTGDVEVLTPVKPSGKRKGK